MKKLESDETIARPHPQSPPSALGMVSYRHAVHQVPSLQENSTQHLLAGEVDGILYHAIVKAELGDNGPPQVADVLLALDDHTMRWYTRNIYFEKASLEVKFHCDTHF